MISLLGIQPTVGFVAKYGIFSFAVKNGFVGLAVFGMLTAVISAYYYLRPLVVMYFRGAGHPVKAGEVPFTLMFSIVFCAVAVVFLGLYPMDYIKMAQLAAGAVK